MPRNLNIQKALQATTSDKQVELERTAAQGDGRAGNIYETVLKRSSQTTEEQNLPQSNIRVIFSKPNRQRNRTVQARRLY